MRLNNTAGGVSPRCTEGNLRGPHCKLISDNLIKLTKSPGTVHQQPTSVKSLTVVDQSLYHFQTFLVKSYERILFVRMVHHLRRRGSMMDLLDCNL
jgi:hypothetical protein